MGVIVKERRPGEWWLYINHNGKRKAKKVGTEQAARHAAAKIEAKLVLNEFEIEKPKPKTLTFQKYAELWLALPHFTPAGDPWKESTFDSYKANLEKHVYPVIGNRPIDTIKRKDIRQLFDKLSMNGLSRSTQSLIKAPVNSVFKYVVDSEDIKANPAAGLSISARKRQPEIELSPSKRRKHFFCNRSCSWPGITILISYVCCGTESAWGN